MDVESTFVCECACSHACTWRRWGTSTDTGVWNQSEGQVRNPPPPKRTALRLLDCLYYCAEKWQQIYGIRVWKANEINRVAELIWNAVFRVTKRGAVCKSVCQYQQEKIIKKCQNKNIWATSLYHHWNGRRSKLVCGLIWSQLFSYQFRAPLHTACSGRECCTVLPPFLYKTCKGRVGKWLSCLAASSREVATERNWRLCEKSDHHHRCYQHH